MGPGVIRRSSVGGCWSWSRRAAGSPRSLQDLGISDQTIYSWRRQDRFDRGLGTGLSSAAQAEFAAARKRIRRARDGSGGAPPGDRAAQGRRGPERRFAAIEVMVAEDLPVQVACRVLEHLR